MGTTRLYIKPFNDDGSYQTNWIDVTSYATNVGETKEDLDSLDFQLGVFRNDSVAIDLNNRDGQFSDVGSVQSIFKYTRADSLVKVTWMEGTHTPVAGFQDVSRFLLSPEVTVFEGLLNDEALTEDAESEQVEFQVLGYGSILQRNTVPFANLAVGQTHQQLIYNILNQTGITSYLTVNLSNINPATNVGCDVIDSFLNQDCQSALDALLLTSNSVLYIRNRVIYVSGRTPSTTVKKIYRGQASNLGPENIVTIDNIKSGIARTINYFYWKTTNVTQKNLASIAKNFTRQQEIDVAYFTDLQKQALMLFNLLSEFKDPKKEFEITVPLYYDELNLQLLDQIQIDYPTVFVPSEGFNLPILGQAVLGSTSTDQKGAVLPRGLWSLTIDGSIGFKILTKQYDPMNDQATFKVRMI